MKHGVPSSTTGQASVPHRMAVDVRGLRKGFADHQAVHDVSIAIPEGTIHGILGPNGAGKTTTLRMILGIIEPDAGERTVLGESDPARISRLIGYLPEERGLNPTMKAADVISFMGATRGMSFSEARSRGVAMLGENGLGHLAEKQIRKLSKGMAQTVQLLGTLVHEPRLVILDEPFSGLDAINQGRLEELIRSLSDRGTTVLFSTHVIAHAERLCESVSIIAGGRVPFTGSVDEAKDTLGAKVSLETLSGEGAWTGMLPSDATCGRTSRGHSWVFDLQSSTGETINPFLRSLMDAGADILSISIDRADLHDAFVHIAGRAAAASMELEDTGAQA